jgi:hypothetical protein
MSHSCLLEPTWDNKQGALSRPRQRRCRLSNSRNDSSNHLESSLSSHFQQCHLRKGLLTANSHRLQKSNHLWSIQTCIFGERKNTHSHVLYLLSRADNNALYASQPWLNFAKANVQHVGGSRCLSCLVATCTSCREHYAKCEASSR